MKALYFKRNPLTHQASDLLDHEKFDKFFSDLDEEDTELQTCLATLKKGDTLYIERVSHLGATEIEAANVLKKIAEREVNVWVNRSQRLITAKDSPFLRVTDKMIQAVKDFKMAFLKYRKDQGWEKAKAEGRLLSRQKKPLPDNFASVGRDWLARRITLAQGAAACNMPISTFRHRCLELQENPNESCQ